MPSRSDLVGAWRLADFHITYADGRPAVAPMGEGAQGLLVYTADGHVSAVLSRADRAALGVGGLEQARHGAAQAKVEAFDTYMSYAGRYHIDGDEVVHTVELALLPDAVGRAQRRHVHWQEGTLVLHYDVTPPSGGTRRYRLTWTRAEAP